MKKKMIKFNDGQHAIVDLSMVYIAFIEQTNEYHSYIVLHFTNKECVRLHYEKENLNGWEDRNDDYMRIQEALLDEKND